jgi:hypothetical protein
MDSPVDNQTETMPRPPVSRQSPAFLLDGLGQKPDGDGDLKGGDHDSGDETNPLPHGVSSTSGLVRRIVRAVTDGSALVHRMASPSSPHRHRAAISSRVSPSSVLKRPAS